MSKKIKVLLAALTLVTISITASIFWYFQTKNYYDIHLSLRTVELQGKLKILRKSNYCAQADDKPDCFQAFLIANEQVKFAQDLFGFAPAITTICDKDIHCEFESTNKLIAVLNIDRLWMIENIKDPDATFKRIYKEELSVIDMFLRTYRKKLVDRYQVEIDPVKKIALVDYAKMLDTKIVDLPNTRPKQAGQ